MNALIGYSGFVGGNLLAVRSYGQCYRSIDIATIRHQTFDHVVCCGVQAMKWWANLHPDEDLAKIRSLLDPLADVRAERFTLISTIDVYPLPQNVDEDTAISKEGHHAYGLNRLLVEDWVQDHFPNVLVMRLPGLFGPGLKKNVIYDLLHDNNLDKVHPGGVFQYYDLRRLADDIDKAWDMGIDVLNISSGPIGTGEIRDQFFAGKHLGATGPAPTGYDMRSTHASAWGGSDGYLYSKQQVMADLHEWVEKEKLKAEIKNQEQELRVEPTS